MKRTEHLSHLFYHIIFTTTIDEYNKKYRNAAKFSSLQLQNSYIILNYSIPGNIQYENH